MSPRLVSLLTMLARVVDLDESRKRLRGPQSGQATVEYALIVLGAAAIALLVVAWAARTGRIDALLDRVFGSVTDNVR